MVLLLIVVKGLGPGFALIAVQGVVADVDLLWLLSTSRSEGKMGGSDDAGGVANTSQTSDVAWLSIVICPVQSSEMEIVGTSAISVIIKSSGKGSTSMQMGSGSLTVSAIGEGTTSLCSLAGDVCWAAVSCSLTAFGEFVLVPRTEGKMGRIFADFFFSPLDIDER